MNEDSGCKIASIGFASDVHVGTGVPIRRLGKGYENIKAETTCDLNGNLSGVDLVSNGKSVWVPIQNISWIVFE